MPDYFIYTFLDLEYHSLFEPESHPIKVEEYDLRYNQELPEDEWFWIILSGKWVSDTFKSEYKQYVSPIFTPLTATIRKVVRLRKII